MTMDEFLPTISVEFVKPEFLTYMLFTVMKMKGKHSVSDAERKLTLYGCAATGNSTKPEFSENKLLCISNLTSLQELTLVP